MATIERGLIIRDDVAHWDGVTRTASRVDATGGTVTGLNFGDEVDVLQVFGNGTNRTLGVINDAITRLGGANATLRFSTGTWTIDDDLTIPSNVTSHIPAGCIFDVSASKTLTFSGPILKESETWTSGSGVVIGSAFISNAFYATTPDETTAGVTIVEKSYIPGHVYRYGTNTTPGTTDMATALNAAISTGHRITSDGEDHYIASAVTFANNDLVAEFGLGFVIKPLSTLLKPVIVGSTSVPARMYIRSLRVDRTTFVGGTENHGIHFLECVQCTFVDPEVRFCKYSLSWLPTSGGFEHNVLINPKGIGGFYNFWLKATGTGYVNENHFRGGRGFCTSDTDTNCRVDAGGLGTGSNHFTTSFEGLGVQAIYDDGTANDFSQCRTEGTWTAATAHVLGPNAIYTNIEGSRIDYTVDRHAVRKARGQMRTYRGGSVMVTANNLLTTLTLENLSASRGTGLEIYTSRQNVDAYVWRSFRKINSASGAHDGGDGQAVLTDSGESFTVNAFVDGIIFNETDGSNAIIAANDGTTITGVLAEGTDNDWDDGDTYVVYLSNGYLDSTGILHTRQKLKVGPTNQTYSESNVSTDRTFDADSTTTAELADVLGTLIVDLRAKGLVD